MLQDSEIKFDVLQEYSPGTRAEKIRLGDIKLNLSEFVGVSDDGEEAVTRRYLMQESKINSTLKVGGYYNGKSCASRPTYIRLVST